MDPEFNEVVVEVVIVVNVEKLVVESVDTELVKVWVEVVIVVNVEKLVVE